MIIVIMAHDNNHIPEMSILPIPNTLHLRHCESHMDQEELVWQP